MKLIVRDVKDKEHVEREADSTRGNILGRRGNVNAIVTWKFEFLTVGVTSIQAPCFITS